MFHLPLGMDVFPSRRRHALPRDSLAVLDFSSAQADWRARLSPHNSVAFAPVSDAVVYLPSLSLRPAVWRRTHGSH